MRLRLAAAVASLLVLLAAVPTGSVYVTTLPSGVDVWLDGTYVGRSPLVLDAVAAGHHTVGLTMTGWSPRQLDVAVLSGQMTFSTTKLDRSASGREFPGRLAIHGGTDVTVDGARYVANRDGVATLPAGTHTIVARVGDGRMTRVVTVWPNLRTDVVLRAEAAFEDAPPSVVAPADAYVPAAAIRVEGDTVTIRAAGHDLVGHVGATSYKLDGRTVGGESAPTFIGTRLYLPIGLLEVFGKRP